MGVGKTTLGRQLAERIGWDFVDLDRVVEIDTGKSISQIFEEEGEEAFRRYEAHLLATVLQRPHSVISTGGGTPVQEGAMAAMLRVATVIWLKASVDTILSRIANDTTRPLLEGLDREQKKRRIETMLANREVYYEQANFSVDTDGRDAQWLVETIYKRMMDSERSK